MEILNKFYNFVSQNKVLVLSFLGLALLTIIWRLVQGLLGYPLLDANISGYDIVLAREAMEAYGDRGRLIYLFSTLILDTFYPVVITLACSGILVKLALRDSLRHFALVPLVFFCVDIAENLQNAGLLLSWPNLGEFQVKLASMTTVLKWQMMTLILILFLIQFGFWFVDFLSRRYTS